MKEIIKKLLYEWVGKQLPESNKRGISLIEYSQMKPAKIIAVTGFRRVGKTFLLFDCAKELLKSNTSEEIVYINFEDERIPLKTEFLTEILPTAKEVFQKKIKYLYLDEIQNMPLWSKWVRRIYDNEQIYIFISGSSSKMSSEEIPTELRGRFIEVRVYPLSLKEFLNFKGISYDVKNIEYVDEEKAKIHRALEEYLKYGGLPEVVLSSERKAEIAQSYYHTVVKKDIIERYNIENEEALKAMMLLLLNAKEYSVTKLYNTLQSMNYKIGKATVLRYLHHIETSYFLFSIPIFSYKIKDRMMYPRKIYCIDNVFITALATSASIGIGRLYENLVARELLKKYKNIFYWKNQQKEEVDFVVEKDNKIIELIQVCSRDAETKDREIRALLKAGKELKCRTLTIITGEYSAEEEKEWFGIKGKITYVPLWKWLLKG